MPRYFVKRTLEKLKIDYWDDIKQFFSVNWILNDADYKSKSIKLAREYICDIYKYDRKNPNIWKKDIAYILWLWKKELTTIEIIAPLIKFLNDVDWYIDGKTAYIKEKIISDAKKEYLMPIQIVKKLESL